MYLILPLFPLSRKPMICPASSLDISWDTSQAFASETSIKSSDFASMFFQRLNGRSLGSATILPVIHVIHTHSNIQTFKSWWQKIKKSKNQKLYYYGRNSSKRNNTSRGTRQLVRVKSGAAIYFSIQLTDPKSCLRIWLLIYFCGWFVY